MEVVGPFPPPPPSGRYRYQNLLFQRNRNAHAAHARPWPPALRREGGDQPGGRAQEKRRGKSSARERTSRRWRSCRSQLHTIAGTPCRATRVAADFLDFIAFCRCSTGVALHPLEILVSHLSTPPLCREVSHRNLGLKRCRATRGCRSYSCGCRATLCN